MGTGRPAAFKLQRRGCGPRSRSESESAFAPRSPRLPLALRLGPVHNATRAVLVLPVAGSPSPSR
jgi:hypothetical protein